MDIFQMVEMCSMMHNMLPTELGKIIYKMKHHKTVVSAKT